ncbi:hypothetical protein [Streptomyces sp. CA2R106]|uniref:hypothetical protein n=1 Tax=Streptomyces sp. CA2R106 TaxID=3120153 RepID=UPI003009EB0D
MSTTTRHLINRQRRLAAVGARTVVRPAPDRTAGPAADPPADPAAPAAPEPAALPAVDEDTDPEADGGGDAVGPSRTRLARRPGRFPLAVALLAALTVLLGGFAAWAAGKASALHDDAATANTALTDNARTAEVKGQIAQDVNSVFSYDYSNTARTDAAAKKVLTGKAVQQYATMIAQVKAAAPKQKLVLTTTVTATGVEMISGDRARVLVYADQSNTSTAKGANAGSAYSAAMLAVDAVRQAGSWKISAIDTFG